MEILLIIGLCCLLFLAAVRGADAMHGARVASRIRDALDGRVTAIAAVLVRLVRDTRNMLTRDFAPRMLHTLAYTALVIIRSAERRLLCTITSLRHLRKRGTHAPQHEAQ